MILKSKTYLTQLKSYNKTASLIEKACKAVAVLSASEARLSSCDKKAAESVIENAKNFGKNIGMAFQIIDDWLDFTASVEQVSKTYLEMIKQDQNESFFM